MGQNRLIKKEGKKKKKAFLSAAQVHIAVLILVRPLQVEAVPVVALVHLVVPPEVPARAPGVHPAQVLVVQHLAGRQGQQKVAGM